MEEEPAHFERTYEYKHKGGKPSYHELQKALLKVYADEADRHFYRLDALRKKPDESVDDYNKKFQQLATRVRSHLDQFTEVHHYIKGLAPLAFQEKVRLALGPTANDIQAAMRAA